jgi:DNA invertase Pin-like site-specific DNA recombinase
MSSVKTAATYSRVSSPNDPREPSLASQEEAQIALLEYRGYTVPPEFRFRERWTGQESIYERPVLLRIRDLVAAGRIQAMRCFDTDRLARNGRELLTVVADNAKHQVETLFVRCDVGLEGRIGELILFTKSWASALEWDSIRDRTMRGRQKLWDKGLWVGGGHTKYGYIWTKETRSRIADPDKAPIIRRDSSRPRRGRASPRSMRSISASPDRRAGQGAIENG